jgi:hypothetical protein
MMIMTKECNNVISIFYLILKKIFLLVSDMLDRLTNAISQCEKYDEEFV